MFDREQEKEAENSNTSPKRLWELAQNYGKGVRERVAQNPNTNAETLAFLVENVNPWLVIDNPKLPLESLEKLASIRPLGAFNNALPFFGDQFNNDIEQVRLIDKLILAHRALYNIVKRLKSQ
jgi:hypothetical protein